MEHALLVLVTLMMTGDAGSDGDRVTVRAMNQSLKLTGWQATWQAKAEIQPPVHPVPGGRMIALLKHRDGDRDLVLWSKEGREIARTKLTLVDEVTASRVFDRRLVLSTATEVAEFDTADLRPGRVRKVNAPASKDTKFLPGPTGVWVVNDRALFYFALDGRPPLQRKRPLAMVASKPPCADVFPNITSPCSYGFQPLDAEMMVSDAGELLMLDVFKELYPVEPTGWSLPDQVLPSITTVLDSNGKVVSQKVSSWMKKTREWFWSVRGDSHNPTPFPAASGLVRTRYKTQGTWPGRLYGTRGSSYLFWLEDGNEMTIHSWSREMKPIWRQNIQALAGGFVYTPSWISPTLLHDSMCYRFSTMSDHGKSRVDEQVLINDINKEKWRTEFKRPRFAIGQSTEGDWLLIAY